MQGPRQAARPPAFSLPQFSPAAFSGRTRHMRTPTNAPRPHAPASCEVFSARSPCNLARCGACIKVPRCWRAATLMPRQQPRGMQAHTPKHRQRAPHHSPPHLYNARFRCCATALNAPLPATRPRPPAAVATTETTLTDSIRAPHTRQRRLAPRPLTLAAAQTRDSGHWPRCCAPSRLRSSIRTPGGRASHTYRKTRDLSSACHRL